jgi:hypothetical protein
MATPISTRVPGTGYKSVQLPRLSPQQQELFSSVMGRGTPGITGGIDQLSQLATGGTPEFWQQMEAPFWRDYEKGLGAIGTRFGQLEPGAMDARRSSAFQHALTGHAGELAENLRSQRLGLQQNAIQQLLQLYGNLMGTQTFDSAFLPKKKSFWQELLGGFAPGAGQGLGTLGSLYGMRKFGLLGPSMGSSSQGFGAQELEGE